jgi:hypothetical protein
VLLEHGGCDTHIGDHPHTADSKKRQQSGQKSNPAQPSSRSVFLHTGAGAVVNNQGTFTKSGRFFLSTNGSLPAAMATVESGPCITLYGPE